MHLATVMPTGAPHSIPVWALYEDGRIAFFTQPGSRKARNLAHDDRVAVSIVDETRRIRTATRRSAAASSRRCTARRRSP
jgi:nitroimidazol reductase NimA-like FMN-containing flavoprotein (pyridoxamine 5'-phosphate oxidase superfamily)